MGISSSTLVKLVNEEFHRLAKGRAYITLDEVLEFRLSTAGWDISTACVGVLYSIDIDKDGTFQLYEVRKFASDWNFLGSSTPPHELQSVVHSLCMAQFWRAIVPDEGLQAAAEWLISLAAQNYAPSKTLDPTEADTGALSAVAADSGMPGGGLSLLDDVQDFAPRTFEKYPGILYLHQQNLPGLYRVLCHRGEHEHDLLSFTHTLQKEAEDKGMMHLDDEELDDWLPQPVLMSYVVEVLQNCRQLVKDMDVLQHIMSDTFEPSNIQRGTPPQLHEEDTEDTADFWTGLERPNDGPSEGLSGGE